MSGLRDLLHNAKNFKIRIGSPSNSSNQSKQPTIKQQLIEDKEEEQEE